MNITGSIHEIFDTNKISDKFQKREFVVVDNENPQYPQYIKMDLTQDKCSILDNYKVGDSVNVSVNIRGNKYEKDGETKYFTSLQAWKIDKDNGAHDITPDHTINQNIASGVDIEDSNEIDSLPF